MEIKRVISLSESGDPDEGLEVSYWENNPSEFRVEAKSEVVDVGYTYIKCKAEYGAEFFFNFKIPEGKHLALVVNRK